MSGQGTITGRGGRFSLEGQGVSRIKMWSVNPKLATSSEWGDSDSDGYTCRTIGRRDATFTAEGVFESTDEIYDVIGLGTLIPAATLFIASGLYYHFPRAICTDMSLNVDVDTEEVVGWTSAWGADGIFYYPGQAGAATVAYPT